MPASVSVRMPQLLNNALPRCDSAEMSVGKNNRKKRSVSFCRAVTVRSTIHYKNMTDDEIKDTWYSHKDTMRFKRKIWSEAKLMATGVPAPANTTWRGLEYRTPEGSARRRENKVNSILAVLDKQDIQRMLDVHDVSTLRSTYLQHTAHCREEARQLGVQDELDAPGDVELEEEQGRRSSRKEVFLRTLSEVVEEVKQLTEI